MKECNHHQKIGPIGHCHWCGECIYEEMDKHYKKCTKAPTKEEIAKALKKAEKEFKI